MIEYVTAKLTVSDVDADGINARVTSLGKGKDSKPCELITFTLKEEPPGPVSSFLYHGTIYMVDKRDGCYFEAIAIKVKGTK